MAHRLGRRPLVVLAALLAPVVAASPAAAHHSIDHTQAQQVTGSTSGSTVTLTNTGSTPGGGTPGSGGGGSPSGGATGGGVALSRSYWVQVPCVVGLARRVDQVRDSAAAPWRTVGSTTCIPHVFAEPEGPPPPTPGEITAAARETVQARVRVAVGAFSVSPEGRTLANLPTRFRAQEPRGVTGRLVNPLTGAAVAYSVTPRPLEWSFGDGGTATGSSVEHAYRRVGTFPVTLTAAWEVRFEAEGGTGPQALPDATDTASRLVTVTQARARLVG